MIDYSTAPIDVITPNGNWLSTYRYEPFLKKWFYLEPDMHERIVLLDRDAAPDLVLNTAKSFDYSEKFSYFAPLKIQVQLNKSCNYRCKMCYAYDTDKNKEVLERSRLSTFFEDAKNVGVVRVNFVGGEVFMLKDFPDVVEEARTNRLLVSCITNGIIPGIAITKFQRVLDQFFNIQISCNGVGASYEHEYGCADWNKASRCIANVISNTKTNILSFVVSENNYCDIPAFLQYANDIKPSVVKFGTICWSGNAKSAKTERYYQFILPEARKLIAKGRDKYGELRIQSQLDQGVFTPLWEDYSSGYRPFEFYFSPEGKDGLYLKSNGDYYPFPLLSEMKEFRLGIIEDGLEHIWNSSTILDELRCATFERSDCGKCGCTSVCGLWNRSYAYSWTGDILGKVPCEHTDWL